jgi:LPXTG-site transpeptidase (sortase) family protein
VARASRVRAAATPAAVSQCNGTDNAGGQAVACRVSVINNLDYGHACHHHACAFTALRNVRSGDAITVTTTARELSYRVCATGISPKSGDLEVPCCANGTPDLVLVTCAYEEGDVSADNLVVVATSTE